MSVQTWRVPLSHLVVTEEDLDAVVATYRSGWLSMGPRTQELEVAFAEHTGARHAIAVTNGTAALHLACVAAGMGPGDEVIVPALTFCATANAVAYTGARPVFADIADVSSPWLSAATVEQVITTRTRAVLTMSYGGDPGDIDGLRDLCADRGLLLLEDACHAAGSRWRGRHVGTFGAIGAFSMFANKNLAVGEGGLVVTDDDDLAAAMRLRRSHGMTSLTWDRHRGHAADYDVVALGYNYRIDEPRATLALSRLARLAADNHRRAQLVERYIELLGGTGLEPVVVPRAGLDAAHHLFTVLLPDGIDRGLVRARMADHGVQTSVHYPPLHRTTAHLCDVALPSTDEHARRTLTLPLFAEMGAEQQDIVVSELVDSVLLAPTLSAVAT